MERRGKQGIFLIIRQYVPLLSLLPHEGGEERKPLHFREFLFDGSVAGGQIPPG